MSVFAQVRAAQAERNRMVAEQEAKKKAQALARGQAIATKLDQALAYFGIPAGAVAEEKTASRELEDESNPYAATICIRASSVQTGYTYDGEPVYGELMESAERLAYEGGELSFALGITALSSAFDAEGAPCRRVEFVIPPDGEAMASEEQAKLADAIDQVSEEADRLFSRLTIAKHAAMATPKVRDTLLTKNEHQFLTALRAMQVESLSQVLVDAADAEPY